MGLGLLGNAISPRGLPLRTPPSRSPEQEFIPLEQAKELWSNGTAIFLDAREPVDYCAGHIGNAFNLPGLHFETHFGEVAPILTPESQIVVYCDGAECDLSHRVSERLKQMRFTNVWILSNGWTVWRQAGFPIQECSAN
jgi:rhodanese-related sulfurtransferase